MNQRERFASLVSITIFMIFFLTEQVAAQNAGEGALGDVIIKSLKGFLRGLLKPVEDLISKHGTALIRSIVGTPHPNSVFSKPTNASWPAIYTYYWQTIIPLSLSLYGLAIGVVIFLESTSHLFSGYHQSKLKKRAFSGLLGILAWWWLAAISLRFTNALTGVIVPSLSNIELFETLSFAGMGVLGVVLALSADLALFLLLALVYTVRHVVLYLFVLLMPLFIVLWIPGIGPFALVSNFVKKLAGFYVPFLLMTLPVAILFRLGGLLGQNFALSLGGVGAWITAMVIPFVALLTPLLFVWQAGSLFSIGNRIARHTSRQHAQTRMKGAWSGTTSGFHGGRNFLRGTRDKQAIRPDGQTMLDSGSSRSHAVGSRLSNARPSLGGSLRRGQPDNPDEQPDTMAETSGPSDESETERDDSGPEATIELPADDDSQKEHGGKSNEQSDTVIQSSSSGDESQTVDYQSSDSLQLRLLNNPPSGEPRNESETRSTPSKDGGDN